MPLIDCKSKLIITWSSHQVTCEAGRAATIAITNTKLYVPVLTLSTQDNTKLLEQLKGSKEQPAGTNINQNYQRSHKITIYIT